MSRCKCRKCGATEDAGPIRADLGICFKCFEPRKQPPPQCCGNCRHSNGSHYHFKKAIFEGEEPTCLCKRFPQTITKDMVDKCGEYALG